MKIDPKKIKSELPPQKALINIIVNEISPPKNYQEEYLESSNIAPVEKPLNFKPLQSDSNTSDSRTTKGIKQNNILARISVNIFLALVTISIIIVVIYISSPKVDTLSEKVGIDNFKSILSETSESDSKLDKDYAFMSEYGEADARRILANYLSANQLSDFIKDVYNYKELYELVKSKWSPLNSDTKELNYDNFKWELFKSDAQVYGTLSGSLPDSSKIIAFYRVVNDTIKLDWKASTAYSTSTLEELIKNNGDGSEMRVKITDDRLPSYHYPDDKFSSFKIYSGNESHILWAYLETSSLSADLLLQLQLEEGTHYDKVTLRLKKLNAAAPDNQWHIEKIIRYGWLDE